MIACTALKTLCVFYAAIAKTTMIIHEQFSEAFRSAMYNNFLKLSKRANYSANHEGVLLEAKIMNESSDSTVAEYTNVGC